MNATLRDRSDRLWSMIVRARDRACVRCGERFGLEAAHIIGRRYRGTRWDPANGRALCRTCHVDVGSTAERWVEIIGLDEFHRLYRQAQQVTKPDLELVYEGLLAEALLVGVSVDERTNW